MVPSHPTPLSHDSKLSTQNPAPRTPTPCKPYTLKALTPFVAAVLSERASPGPWKQRPLVNVGVGFRVQACESFKAKKGTTMVPFWASLRAFGFLGRGSGFRAEVLGGSPKGFFDSVQGLRLLRLHGP